MDEDVTENGERDKPDIQFTDDCNIKDWCLKLKVTPDELRKAIASVGSDAKAIQDYFNSPMH